MPEHLYICINIYIYMNIYGYTLLFWQKSEKMNLWHQGKAKKQNFTVHEFTSSKINFNIFELLFFGRCSLTEFLTIQQNKNKNNITFGSFGGTSIGLTGSSVSPLCTSPFFSSPPPMVLASSPSIDRKS